MIVVEHPDELLQYFDEDQLFLLSHVENETNWERYQKKFPEKCAQVESGDNVGAVVQDRSAGPTAEEIVTMAPSATA